MSFLEIFTHCCGSRHQGLLNPLTECRLCSPVFHTNKRSVRYIQYNPVTHTHPVMWWHRQQTEQATEIPTFPCLVAFGILGVSYCVRKRSDKLYVFSGKVCEAYEKDVSGHKGILVKVAQNRLCPFFHTQLFSCCRETDCFQTRGDAPNIKKKIKKKIKTQPKSSSS